MTNQSPIRAHRLVGQPRQLRVLVRQRQRNRAQAGLLHLQRRRMPRQHTHHHASSCIMHALTRLHHGCGARQAARQRVHGGAAEARAARRSRHKRSGCSGSGRHKERHWANGTFGGGGGSSICGAMTWRRRGGVLRSLGISVVVIDCVCILRCCGQRCRSRLLRVRKLRLRRSQRGAHAAQLRRLVNT